ncbi:hypothetical protein BDZ94DRAFT_1242962 [Collybia nuda]|uniref:Uncharacterized protein n=1 Tax=Collybia nuda TaxID=64659 RepID=A0A9P5YJD3_9AGAR|nr:hypothetical protein BDZ94DRAFT_1242962 [Collybia nuda]
MAPLIYSSWWRRARTSVDNETPITLAGNISVATTTDGGSDSAPSASSPLDKPSGKEPSRMSGAKPAATHSVNAPNSTPEPHHSKEVNPSRISQTSINNVPEGTSTPTPPKEFTSETKISSSTSTETRSSEKSTTISTTSSSGTSTSGSTMSPRTDGGGSESTTASTLITSPTVTETLANPGAIPPSAPLTPNTPNSTPNDDRDSSTIIILPSLNVATSTNQFIPTRTSGGDTVSPSSTPDPRVASTGTAQAENAPESLFTTLIIEVTSSEFRTTISSDHIITKDVTIFSTRTRTSVVSYPTSTVVGTTSTGTK